MMPKETMTEKVLAVEWGKTMRLLITL
jgi:hypothetical protein